MLANSSSPAYIKLELTHDRLRSFVCSFVRYVSFDFVRALFQHFLLHVLYSWLYSLWKSVK